jgi:hypothetical protein
MAWGTVRAARNPIGHNFLHTTCHCFLSPIPWSRGGLDVDREIRLLGAIGGLCAMAPPSAETSRVVLSLVLDLVTQRDELASVIPAVYRTCTKWRKELSDEGFHMRTFALCTALSDVAQAFKRTQAIIGQQLEQTSDKDETDQAWWLDARSLVQRCNSHGRPRNVWSWLQAASQEPDGPLSRQAASTARVLGQHLVCWPDKP